MSKKRRPVKKQAAKTDSKRVIQIVAVVVIVLAVAGIIWAIVANQKSSQTAAQPPAQPTAEIGAQPTSQPAALTSGKQWPAPPPMTIDKSKQYFANFKMAKGGEFVVQLYPDKAPITVNSFVFLANQGFYNGTTFHRVLKDFMAQGGDPTGTGMGGPGYKFVNEDSDLTFDKPGVVAMANSGRDTNGSQFFITFVPYPSLNGGYTIFGQVTSGMDVVNKITLRNPDENPTFTGDVISSITITEK